jgi:integrase
MTRIIITQINLGALPYFETNTDGKLVEEDIGEHTVRVLSYHRDRILPDFPLLSCPHRLRECMEFNLFLIDRRLGNFSLKKSKHTETEKRVWSEGHLASKKAPELKTESLIPIAKDLRKYLDWMIEQDISYEEIIAIPENYDPNSLDEAEALLPVWRFQQFLVKQVEGQKLAFNRCQRILSNVRAFYLWSYKRSTVKFLPFSIHLKSISVKRKDDAEATFSLPGSKPVNMRAIESYVSNLSIPKTAKRKSRHPREGLSAYTAEELRLLMNTKIYAHRTYGLFIRCALFAGLRVFEVVQIDYKDIIDPAENRFSFSLNLVRKFDKSTNLRISPTLMQMLWGYTQDDIYTRRRLKHETRYGMNNPDHPLPLFINRNGERMSESTVTNTIQKCRLELKERGLPRLDRDFHDLRATFATYWAIALLKKGYTPNEIKAKLILLLSHETFKTTQLYLDFALEGKAGKHGAMEPWVVDIYQEVMDRVNAS